MPVATGRFRQHMEVELVNDGPVTLMVESSNKRDRWSMNEGAMSEMTNAPRLRSRGGQGEGKAPGCAIRRMRRRRVDSRVPAMTGSMRRCRLER